MAQEISLARTDATQPSTEDWANIFGPSAYNMQPDLNRNRKFGRLHMPDVLKGPNQWITDRVDGLITDTTKSPFTTMILPYMYMEYPDRKIEWNVWTFDQGLASRVPYESAARTLTQRKQAFSGYTVRQGLAITMEHNFMMSKEGIENFQNQVTQVVNSIQNTNDLDVHMALINAPSYLTQTRERYFMEDYLSKSIRDYIDGFGFVQKNMNAVDIMIEDTKALILSWGGEEPDFMMCSGRLTYQMTMLPEKTNYYTQGPDGKKLLKDGPDLPMYRGLKIIKSKAFSLEDGNAPKDLMRRRVRVCEYYVGLLPNLANVHLYDEDSDAMKQLSRTDLLTAAYKFDPNFDIAAYNVVIAGGGAADVVTAKNVIAGVYKTLLLIRPNIEHYMLGVIIGRGGIDHLGATLWGQTEMSVFDDGQHGVWGMTYKYHERAIVFNERNMHRIWDVSYDGYCGGKGVQCLQWRDSRMKTSFEAASNDLSKEYEGPSIIVVPIAAEISSLPSPLVFGSPSSDQSHTLATADLLIKNTLAYQDKINTQLGMHKEVFNAAVADCYTKLGLNNSFQIIKDAQMAAAAGEATHIKLMYQGTASWHYIDPTTNPPVHISGSGHHGHDTVCVAAVRNGKQYNSSHAPAIHTL